eukprot:72195-Ditylum_brightwellii.AAC.1
MEGIGTSDKKEPIIEGPLHDEIVTSQKVEEEYYLPDNCHCRKCYNWNNGATRPTVFITISRNE